MSVWDQVVGQEAAVAVLRAAVRNPQAMTHAWLITGPPGSGRSNAARAFAAALQCPSGGCGACPACATALAGTHADVTVVATEKVTISIEEVRDLIGIAQRSPSQGRWRVIVVEDADRMTERTSNVLLKAIEEPPPRTVWLLCSTSPQDVQVTIRSRCRALGLRVPPVEAVARLLIDRDGVEPDVADVAARAAQSHIGMARRLARDPDARERRRRTLELVTGIRGVGDAVLAAADLVDVAQAEAKAATEDRDAAERAALLHTLGAEDATRLPPALRAQVRQLTEDQKRRATRAQRDVLDRSLLDLLSLYRDVLVLQLGADVDPVNVEHTDQVRRLAQDSTPEQTLHRMDVIGETRTRLAGNVAPLLAIEAMAVALRPQDGRVGA
ncbi:DNA polymerase III subunit delta' [Isoptericola sp. b441]|uniref:DNA polymerase III subunit delta n=1 Tax=Actinotalea lenta TaxID=3064654 RepID=A0ABT9D6T5_9CELL|nr:MULTISPECIES: DNA polymerase III subunit delta' [unclassified Isoptericola]MDO8106552.1 DNA polymerase III subunit delta' [Isoptericola sp. b441]MDO8121740.1 DNA polymerase III subunit delta' [Isoptericola sp. b490]